MARLETNLLNSISFTNKAENDQIEISSKTTNKSVETTTGGNKGAFLTQPRKIANGGVLQYPIDLDTNIQDYFEIQSFEYRASKRLPNLNQDTYGSGANGLLNSVNRRGQRQNFRLKNIRSTIQLPIPNSLKDNNSVQWGPGEMSSVAGGILGPIAQGLLGDTADYGSVMEQASKGETSFTDGKDDTGFGLGFLEAMSKAAGGTIDAATNNTIRRRSALTMINKATSNLGISVNVDEAITRIGGVVENTNLELLLGGPALRSFSFSIRFTPRSPEESERIRMIIRVLKQHSAVKKNPISYGDFDGVGTNFLLGTPDVFKLRYIKAKTQKDIKGLNKFKTCALQSVSVDYTGEAARFAAYDEDSQPVTTLVTLNFTELVPLYDEDYHEFNNDDDVGL